MTKPEENHSQAKLRQDGIKRKQELNEIFYQQVLGRTIPAEKTAGLELYERERERIRIETELLRVDLELLVLELLIEFLRKRPLKLW